MPSRKRKKPSKPRPPAKKKSNTKTNGTMQLLTTPMHNSLYQKSDVKTKTISQTEIPIESQIEEKLKQYHENLPKSFSVSRMRLVSNQWF